MGNDSCGVEAEAKYNDTDLCWGPLHRVDAYRIYLVSGRPGWPRGLGAARLHSRLELSPERRVYTAPQPG